MMAINRVLPSPSGAAAPLDKPATGAMLRCCA